jgi:uncharacterized HAD superfamily protein
MKAIIVDIDGTLADKGERHPFDYDQVDKDTPRKAIVTLVQYLYNYFDVLILSGREDSCEKKTKAWLKKHDIPNNALYMRKTGDHRTDCIIKKEIFDEHIKDKYEILFVLDDRDQVVKMWREELGLDCLQVNYGDF